MAAGYSVPFRLRGSGFLAAVSVRFLGRAPAYRFEGTHTVVPGRSHPSGGCPAIETASDCRHSQGPGRNGLSVARFFVSGDPSLGNEKPRTEATGAKLHTVGGEE